jgi:hypothetical protein
MEEALVRGEDHGHRRRLGRWHPASIALSVLRRPFVYWVPFCPFYDRLYSLWLFLRTYKRWPGHYLFNDRLVRLKLDGELRDPLRQALTDKVFVKQYAEGLLGSGSVPKTYAVLATAQEIREYEFPKECVVKPCHTCGDILFVRDGVVDKKLVASWLKMDFYRESREQNYAFVKPRIIVEEFAFGPETIPDDYKVFCVDGVPKVILVFFDRFTGMSRRFYDTDWNPQPFALQYPLGREVPRPGNLEQMLEAAAKLARGTSLLRVDLYTNGETFKVGEITNCHGSANETFSPPEGERQLSALMFGEER